MVLFVLFVFFQNKTKLRDLLSTKCKKPHRFTVRLYFVLVDLLDDYVFVILFIICVFYYLRYCLDVYFYITKCMSHTKRGYQFHKLPPRHRGTRRIPNGHLTIGSRRFCHILKSDQ